MQSRVPQRAVSTQNAPEVASPLQPRAFILQFSWGDRAMKRHLVVTVSIAILAGLAAGVAVPASGNAANNPGGNEAWSTKKIMKKVHFGKQALLAAVYRDIQKAEPDWQTDEKNLAEIIRLMSMLSE